MRLVVTDVIKNTGEIYLRYYNTNTVYHHHLFSFLRSIQDYKIQMDIHVECESKSDTQ